MEIQKELDAVYTEAVQPIENFDSSHPKGTITRMGEYLKVIGEAIEDFAGKAERKGNELLQEYPNKKEEIEKYIKDLVNKLVSTYKPK